MACMRAGSSTWSTPSDPPASCGPGWNMRRPDPALRREGGGAGSGGVVSGMGRGAMEYAPRVSNPYVARVDGGTIEMVRSLGVDVVSSGDLVQLFESTWDDAQWQSHLEAAVHTQSA